MFCLPVYPFFFLVLPSPAFPVHVKANEWIKPNFCLNISPTVKKDGGNEVHCFLHTKRLPKLCVCVPAEDLLTALSKPIHGLSACKFLSSSTLLFLFCLVFFFYSRFASPAKCCTVRSAHTICAQTPVFTCSLSQFTPTLFHVFDLNWSVLSCFFDCTHTHTHAWRLPINWEHFSVGFFAHVCDNLVLISADRLLVFCRLCSLAVLSQQDDDKCVGFKSWFV